MNKNIFIELLNKGIELSDIKVLIDGLDKYSYEDNNKIYRKLKACSFDKRALQLVENLITLEKDAETIVKLLGEIKKRNYNSNVLKFLNRSFVLNFRSVNEVVKLLDKFEKNNYNEKLYIFMSNYDILELRTFDEQMKLINKYINSEYNSSVKLLATSSVILKNRTIEEQLKLIDELKKCEYNDKALKFITNKAVVSFRTCDEQIKLLRELKEWRHFKNAFDLATEIVLLQNKTCDDQIKLMRLALNNLVNYSKICSIMLNATIIKNLTTDDLIILINGIIENFNSTLTISSICSNELLLKKRTVYEIVKLLNLLNSTYMIVDYKTIIDLILNEYFLNNLSNEEHIMLINFYINSNYNGLVCKFITSELITSCLTIDKETKILELMKTIDFKKEVLDIFFSPDILKKDFNDIVELVNKIKGSGYNYEVIKIIKANASLDMTQINLLVDEFLTGKKQVESSTTITFSEAITKANTMEELKVLSTYLKGVSDTRDVIIDKEEYRHKLKNNII